LKDKIKKEKPGPLRNFAYAIGIAWRLKQFKELARAGRFLAPGSPVGGYFQEDRHATACACFKVYKPIVVK
jgi:hypothetical protein